LNSVEDHKKGHEIIYNGARNELPQANNNNGVKTIIVITRIEQQQEV
jgi:hypothetical protein